MSKKARLYIRLTTKEKRDFEKAAKATGMTLTEWVIQRCLDGIAELVNE